MEHLSAATVALLRNCQIIDAVMGQADFVRCIPDSRNRFKQATDAMLEIGEDGVFVASNKDFGGDYLRVNTNTRTFDFICQMKS